MNKMLEVLHKPKIMSKFHGAMTLVWLVMLPVSAFTPLKNSVPFLVAISIWALVGAHWAAYQGARSEMSNNDG